MRMRVTSRGPSATGRFAPLALVFALVAGATVGLAGTAAAQTPSTPFFPYYSKNNIHYDTFDWHIYTTDHFEIYYYPEQ